MKKSKDIVKRNPGRPVKIAADQFVGLRLTAEQLRRIDSWATANKTQRSDAIRRLVDIGLGAAKRSRG